MLCFNMEWEEDKKTNIFPLSSIQILKLAIYPGLDSNVVIKKR